MKFVRDSVHGDLQLDEFEVKLVDTPEIQRLRRIKQLGFTYLVCQEQITPVLNTPLVPCTWPPDWPVTLNWMMKHIL